MMDWYELVVADGSINSYRFDDPGRSERYRFRMYAVDGAGNIGPMSDEWEIPNLAPKAVISSTKMEAGDILLGETIFVSANTSHDPDGQVTNYFWNFGDGSFSYSKWAYHTYHFPQKYDLTLTVYDDFGKHDRTTTVINVTERGKSDPTTGDDSEFNETKGSEDDGNNATAVPEKDEVSFSEIVLESPVSYILGITLILCILLFGAEFISTIISKRRERKRTSHSKSLDSKNDFKKKGKMRSHNKKPTKYQK